MCDSISRDVSCGFTTVCVCVCLSATVDVQLIIPWAISGESIATSIGIGTVAAIEAMASTLFGFQRIF